MGCARLAFSSTLELLVRLTDLSRRGPSLLLRVLDSQLQATKPLINTEITPWLHFMKLSRIDYHMLPSGSSPSSSANDSDSLLAPPSANDSDSILLR